MADATIKPAFIERRKNPMPDKTARTISILGIIVPVALFIILWFLITPARTGTENMNELKTKVQVLETKRENDDRQTAIDKADVMRRFDAVDRKLDRVIEMHMEGGTR